MCYFINNKITLKFIVFVTLYIHICVEEILSCFFPWDLPVVKISLNGLRAPSRVSPAVGLLPLTSGLACLRISFRPVLVKQLYRRDSVVISSFVRTGYTTRRRGWLLGRIGYSITHHYPLYPYGRPLKRLMDTWDLNGSTSGPTPWKIWWWWWWAILLQAVLLGLYKFYQFAADLLLDWRTKSVSLRLWFGYFTTMLMTITVSWYMTPFGLVICFRRFGGPCRLTITVYQNGLGLPWIWRQ